MASEGSTGATGVSPVEWPTVKGGYQLLQRIGKGAAATVYRARALCRDRDREVAVKVIELENSDRPLEDIQKECQIGMCNHTNVVPYYTSFIHESQIWLVMGYMEGGSVLDIMKYSHPQGLNDEALIATLLRDALRGIEYIHSQGRIHRDIKAGNLLVDKDGTVRLGDFGVSATLQEGGLTRTNRQTFVGTPCWMAPEVMEQVHGYDYKADIWSFGITALELAHGQAPLAKFPPMKVLLLTLQNPPPTLESGKYSKTFRDMVEHCLQKDPSKRPTAARLLEHRFFKQARKPDYVQSSLLKKLPPLWERPQNEAGDDGASAPQQHAVRSSSGQMWVFDDSDSAPAGKMVPSSSGGGDCATTERAASPTVEKRGRFTLTDTTQSRKESDAQPPVVQKKGRFTVKSDKSSSTADHSSNSTATASTATEEKRDRSVSQIGRDATAAGGRKGKGQKVDPLTILPVLQQSITFVMQENERLKKENAMLRSKLAALEKQ